MKKTKKFDRRNGDHRKEVKAILYVCAAHKMPWEEVVKKVKEYYDVTNWLSIRAVLQELRDAGLVKRVDDIFDEVYVLVHPEHNLLGS